MTIQLSINLEDTEEGREVQTDHFGINFVADWERIGDKPWEKFDEVLSNFSEGTVRYPGGITAEIGFDITDPNAELIVLEDGATRKIMGAFDFAEYCKENGYAAGFIIPTAQLLSSEKSEDGLRHFDPDMADELYDYVYGLLESGGGAISVLEIGNEYEGYMSSREYGALVNEIAPIINEAITDYLDASGHEFEEPSIAMQVWSSIANEDSTQTTEDLQKRAENALDELSDEALACIDTLVTHWYAKDRSRSYQDAYFDLEDDIQSSFEILDNISELIDTDFSYLLSEWNANHKETQFFGLAQVPILLKMFAEFAQAGVDSSMFWSAMYQATSLSLSNGEMTAAGVTLEFLSSHTIGTTVYDVDFGSESVGGVAFVGEDSAFLTMSNLTSDTIDVALTNSELFLDYVIISIGYISVDEAEADGEYKGFSGLELYNEPDLPAYLLWNDFTWSDYDGDIELESYETVIMELEQRVEVSGTAENDYFYAEELYEKFVGGSGIDTVDYSASETGIAINLLENSAQGDDAENDVFISIENIVGSHFDDTITGTNQANVISGGLGQNTIYAGGGSDTVISEGLGDQLFMEFGNDFAILTGESGAAFGGKGDDKFVFVSGHYSVDGGAGEDVLDMSNFESGVNIWFSDGQVEFNYGVDAGLDFKNIEVVVGTAFSDRFNIREGSVQVNLEDGNDYAQLRGQSSVVIDMGNGDDFIYAFSLGNEIELGAGNDTFYSGFGSTNVISGGVGNDHILSFGNDQICFDIGDGNDDIFGFEPFVDSLVLGFEAQAAMEAENYSIAIGPGGSFLIFDTGDNIFFADVSVDALETYIDSIIQV